MRIGHEYFSEIIDNLKRNRLRTFLTGFAVAWGIIFLVILLSIGVGLNRGISKGAMGSDMTPNSGVRFGLWMTSIPYQGYQAGRPLYLAKPQLAQLQQMVPAIEDIAPAYQNWSKITYEAKVSDGWTLGISANHFGHFDSRVKILAGRSISGYDTYNREKVILLSSAKALHLFGSESYVDALGKKVSLDDISFTIIGVYEDVKENSGSFIPSTTFEALYPAAHTIDRVYAYVPSIRSDKDYKAFEQKLRQALGSMLTFSPDDESAMWGFSNYANNEQYNKVVNYFYLFLWIVGLSTLLIGIVGVSNIMLVTVRERYKEIGIRKALGAKPRDILAMIMVESLLITAVAGAIGLVIAVGFVALGDYLVTAYHIGEFSVMGETIHLFDTPVLSPQMALGILVVMIIAGIVAGYTPARRAIRISAIEAMRD